MKRLFLLMVFLAVSIQSDAAKMSSYTENTTPNNDVYFIGVDPNDTTQTVNGSNYRYSLDSILGLGLLDAVFNSLSVTGTGDSWLELNNNTTFTDTLTGKYGLRFYNGVLQQIINGTASSIGSGGSAPTIQADDPTIASDTGEYIATTSGDRFYVVHGVGVQTIAGTWAGDETDPVIGTITPSALTHDGLGATLTATIASVTETNESSREWSLYDVTDAAIEVAWTTFTGLSISGITIPADQHTYRVDVRCTDLAGNVGSGSSSNIVYEAVEYVFNSEDSVYVICPDAYWTENSALYAAANVDGHYQTMNEWETAQDGVDSANQNSIVLINGVVQISTAFETAGWTAKDSAHYIVLRNDPVLGTTHDGTNDGSGDTIEATVNTGYPLRFGAYNTKIINLKISSNGSTTSSVMYLTSLDVVIDRCLFYYNSPSAKGLHILPGSAGIAKISNSFFIAGSSYTATSYVADLSGANLTSYFFGNSIMSSARGVLGNTATKLRNNCNFAASSNYSGAMDIDYEATNAASGAGVNSAYSLSASNVYVDTSYATADLHLNSGGSSYASVNNAGVDLHTDANLAVTIDIDGDTRSLTTPNIGGDE